MGNVALAAASPHKAAGHDGSEPSHHQSPMESSCHQLLPLSGLGGIQAEGGNTVLMEVMTYQSQPVVGPAATHTAPGGAENHSLQE